MEYEHESSTEAEKRRRSFDIGKLPPPAKF
jgi:hypothetical protein